MFAAGVFDQYKTDKTKLPHHEQYIWKIESKDDIELVITMRPNLIKRIHNALYTVHDNKVEAIHIPPTSRAKAWQHSK